MSCYAHELQMLKYCITTPTCVRHNTEYVTTVIARDRLLCNGLRLSNSNQRLSFKNSGIHSNIENTE